jgi:hypothetical protein
MTTARERRVILIFWAVTLLLIFGTFAADALFRHETCVSAMTLEAGVVVQYPEVCR